MTNNKSIVVEIQKEVTKELASKEVMSALLATTFKGLGEVQVKQAITEGMMRGFYFKDFLEKNVYAIPFNKGANYSLITSIDYARKIGQKNGVVGKSAPSYETVVVNTDTGKEEIISCTVTVKKKVGDYVGDFTETVYFEEYYKKGYDGKPTLWETKPRTMIAKVAEMHALRTACPEELAKAYVEEEMQQEVIESSAPTEEDVIVYTEKLESAKSVEELGKFWAELPGQIKVALNGKKDEIKAKLK